MEAIDTLPTGPKWNVQEITLKGELGEEDVEFYYRDALECVEELMGNPMFKEHMKYAPERHWKGGKRAKNRQYNECWTGDWWWKIQVSLDKSEHRTVDLRRGAGRVTKEIPQRHDCTPHTQLR